MSSDASRTSARIVEEATAGTTPATPAFETLRPTAIGLSFVPKTKVSAELVADRNVTDLIPVGREAGGDLPQEMSYGTLDTLIRGAQMSDWTYFPVRDNNGTADSVITDVSSTLYTFTTAAAPLATGKTINTGTFAAGHLVFASGFGVTGNNGLKVLTAASATTATATGLATEAAPPAAARLKVVGIQGGSGDISTTATTIVSATLNFATLGIVAGMWLKVGGTSSAAMAFATAANNDWVRVSAVATGTLTLDVTPSGWGVDAGTSKTIQLFVGDAIRNGTTARSYTCEVEYADLATPEWDYYTGMRVGTMEWTNVAQDILEAKFSFMGFNASNVTTRFTGATTVAAATGNVMSSGLCTGELRINNSLVGLGPNYVKEFTISLDNTLRRQPGVGTLGDIGIGLGRAMVKGKVSTYYGSNAVRTALLNGTAMSLNCIWYDPNVVVTGAYTSAYHSDIPKLKWVDGNPSVTAVDTDRMLDLNYQALKNTLGFTLQVQRFDYIPT